MSLSTGNSATLVRYRPAILALTAVAAGCTIYYIHNIIWSPSGSLGPTLRRRNAIHRSRQRRRDQELEVTYDNAPDGHDAVAEPQTVNGGPSTVANDSESEHSWREAVEDRDSKKEGQSLLNLLYHIAEDQARRDGYVHRQVTCNSCNTIPIRGIRYRCANCVDYDLCEQCEALQVHQKTHVFYKIRIPAPFPFLGNPRQPQPVWYPGKPSGLQQRIPRELTIRLCKESSFEDAEVNALWDQFKCLAATEWPDDPNHLYTAIDRRTFDRCFLPSTSLRPPPPNLIYDLMFAFYDIDGDGLIGFEEFVLGLASLRTKNQDDKLRRVFRGYDLDRDGYVNRKDFLRMFRAYYALVKELARDYVAGMEEDILESGARDVVASSQPLSSAFSGTISTGEPSRTGHGKSEDVNGDLIVIDGQGIARESGREEGDYHEVVGDTREAAVFSDISPTKRDYFASMLVPDGQFVDSDIDVPHDHRDSDEVFFGDSLAMIRREAREEADERIGLRNSNGEGGGNSDQGFDPGERANNSGEELLNGDNWHWPPALVQVQDVEAALGNYIAIPDIKSQEDRMKVMRAAQERMRSENMKDRQSVRQKAIRERWLRRQFYLDEENGALPPPGFEDVPEDSIGVEPLAAQTALNSAAKRQESSRRSRSSSKVRFEDDLNEEEHETRSNTSMSSRSIPLGERWGGYEMPEAEKDVGREVLYQVTQEGLNEMLDPIFKQREDLAIEASRTLPERQKTNEQSDAAGFSSEPMSWLIETQTTEFLRKWRIKGDIEKRPAFAEIHPIDTEQAPSIVYELRNLVLQESILGTTEYQDYMDLRRKANLPVSTTHTVSWDRMSIPWTIISEPLNSNPVGLSQNDAYENGTSSVGATAAAASLSKPPPPSPATTKANNGPSESMEAEYPAAAMELHSAVAAFNEADPTIEKEILQKPLDQLLQDSGYGVADNNATSEQTLNSSTRSVSLVDSISPPAIPTSQPNPTLPQDRPDHVFLPSQSTPNHSPAPSSDDHSTPKTPPPTNSPPNPSEPNLSTAASRFATLLDLPSRPLNNQQPDGTAPSSNEQMEAQIPQSRLKYLAMLNFIEHVDEQRGGPGRINFEEFEEIMKSERGRNLGFVGHWVEMASF
ncbi:hypothetical protein MMC14_001232 [Varicellaria rhodocarpa]|nr:hypothetical protein [Varicellaria rhodocarpa]